MILEPEVLDRLYREWRNSRRSPDYTPSRWDEFITYQRQYRNGENSKFEDWLFDQGFTVIQRDGKRYLKFSGDERRLTFFLLKHGKK